MRFLHLKVLGEPLDALKEQAQAAGLDPAYLDKEFPDYRTIPEYTRFFDDRRRGVAVEVVKQKMVEEGLDENVLDVYDMGETQVIRVDYVRYIEWFRRKEAGEDVEALAVEMEKEGLDASVLEHDVNSIEFINIPYQVIISGDERGLVMVPSSEVVAPAASAGSAASVAPAASVPATCQHHYEKMVDFAYYKFFKLLKNHLPKEGLQMKMQMENLDPSVLDLDLSVVGFTNIPEDTEVTYPDGHVEPCVKPGDVVPAAPAASVPATCQHHYEKMVDFAYYKFFKLLNNHLPKEGLKMKMQMENLDPSVIDMDMSVVGFTNIPEDTEIAYPDGHVEPCVKPGALIPAASAASAASTASASATCPHRYAKLVDYEYYKHFKSLHDGVPKKQVLMRVKLDCLDPSVLDLDMSTVGFTDIPEGKEVVYPDGHVEPCVKVPTVAKPALRSAASLKPRMSMAVSASRSVEKPKEEVMQPRKKFAHKAKLRAVYWDNITSKAVLEKSMWVKLDDRAIKLDTGMLDAAFAAKDIAVLLPTEPVKKEESKVVNLLDAKREKNVGISIGRLKVDVKTIHHALLFGDFSVLTKDILPLLVNAAPTEEEQVVCNAYQGEVAKLSEASRFAYELSDIPSVQMRLECCRTIATMDDEEARLHEMMQIYESNLQYVKNSQGLKTLCQILLAIGNYLNGDSARGGAWGFRIEYLRKINTTKCADGTRTLAT